MPLYIKYLLVSVCLLAYVATYAQSVPLVEYPANVKQAGCGQTGWQGWPQAPNSMHQYYNLDSAWAQPGMIYADTGWHERVFTFTLDSAAYVYIKQPTPYLQRLFLLGDSSNAHLLAYSGDCLNIRLAAGRYYLAVEDMFHLSDPLFYPTQTCAIIVACSPSPIVLSHDAKPYAVEAPINTHFRTTVADAGSHVDTYVGFSPWWAGVRTSLYYPQPERVLRFTIPDSSRISYAVGGSAEVRTYLMDSAGNTFHTLVAPAAYPAGTYYLAIEQGSTTYQIIEQGSTTLADSVDVFIDVHQVLPGCQPLHTVYSFDYLSPLYRDEEFKGSLNGARYSNFNYAWHYTNYQDLFIAQDSSAVPIYVDGYRNEFTTTIPGNFVRIYADLNQDHDFTDTGELLYSYRRPGRDAQGHRALYFANGLILDSSFSAQYHAALGKRLRLRILLSDDDTTGPCDRRDGVAVDMQAIFKLPPTGLRTAKWVHTLTDKGATNYKHVGVTSTGNIVVAGESSIIILNNSSGSPPNPHFYFSDNELRFGNEQRGDSVIYTAMGEHWVFTYMLAFASYTPDGKLRWADKYSSTICTDGICPASEETGEFTSLTNVSATGPGSCYAVGMQSKFGEFNVPSNKPLRGGAILFGDTGIAGSFTITRSLASILTGLAYSPDSTFNYCGYINPFGADWSDPDAHGDSIAYKLKGGRDGFVGSSGQHTGSWLVKIESANDEQPSAIVATPDGTIYVSGNFTDSVRFISTASPTVIKLKRNSLGLERGFLLALSRHGVPLWATRLPGNIYVRDMLSCKDTSGFVLTGNFTGTMHIDSLTTVSTGYQDVFALKLNRAGRAVWLSSGGGPGYDYAERLRQDSAGNFLLSYYQTTGVDSAFGDTLPAYGHTGHLLTTLDAQTGRLLPGPGFSRLYPIHDFITDMAPLPGGDIIMAGTSNPGLYFPQVGQFANNAGYLARVTHAGAYPILPTVATRQLSVPKGDGLQVYPNPSTGRAWVRLAGAKSPQALQITDALGREVVNISVPANELAAGAQLAVPLPNGLYSFRCGKATARLVVQQ